MRLTEEQLRNAAVKARDKELAALPAELYCPDYEVSEQFEQTVKQILMQLEQGTLKPDAVRMGWQYYTKRSAAVFLLCAGLTCAVMPDAVMAAYQRIAEIDFAAIIRNSTVRLIFVYLVQFILCTRENKFLGLILPAYYFISSIILLVNSFSNAYFMELNRVFHIYLVFLMPNANTVLFLFMYFVLRKFYVEKK